LAVQVSVFVVCLCRPERPPYASPGYNPGVEMNEIKQRPVGAQYKT